MALKNFDLIVERAKESFKPLRVVIAGADAENMLLGAFQAQDEALRPLYWLVSRIRSSPCWNGWV